MIGLACKILKALQGFNWFSLFVNVIEASILSGLSWSKVQYSQMRRFYCKGHYSNHYLVKFRHVDETEKVRKRRKS